MYRTYTNRRSLLCYGLLFTLVYVFCKLFLANEEKYNFKLHRYSAGKPFDVLSAFRLSLNRKYQRRLVQDVNCAAILDGDVAEIDKAKELTENGKYSRNIIKDKEYVLLTRNCKSFKEMRGYENYFASTEEAQFPIAYSILLYKGVEQAERLLRSIYTPQNYYCLHVDAYSEQDVHDAIHGVANCFDNVFVVSRKEFVVYAGFTRLQADINCMEDLVKRGEDWKYFINLPSQEFPLKTNKEIVNILKIYNGANDIEGKITKEKLNYRYTHRFQYRHVNNRAQPKIFETDQGKENPPFNITVVKGGAYGIFCREFIHFVLNNEIARMLLDWFRDVLSPDEYYWATLNFNHHIGTPGAYFKGIPDDIPRLAVFVAWSWKSPCHGKYVRGVCVFGVGDLKSLVSKTHLFANKFYNDYQPYALDCMEEWHLNRTAEGSLMSLNISYYKSLPFIKPTETKPA